jgi:hypothetical protein
MPIQSIQWLIFLHVLGALTFYMAHGASAAMALKVRKETDFARIRALLDLSGYTLIAMGIAFLVMGLTGLALPFLMHLWGRLWVWLSVILLLFVTVYMSFFNESYKELRRLVGLPYRKGNNELPAEPPSGPQEVAAVLGKIKVMPLIIVGYLIPAFILWLMIFKPF